MRAGERGRVHEHERQEEVFVVLEGTLDVDTPDGITEVAAGGAVRIAPEVRRQMVNRGPGRCVVLALGGAEAHDGRDGRAFADFADTEPKRPQDVPQPDALPAHELRS